MLLELIGPGAFDVAEVTFVLGLLGKVTLELFTYVMGFKLTPCIFLPMCCSQRSPGTAYRIVSVRRLLVPETI
jgi:hypothetical protein